MELLELSFEAYGFRIGFRFPSALAPCIDEIILPTWSRNPSGPIDAWLTVRPVVDGFEILDDGKPWTTVKADPGAEPLDPQTETTPHNASNEAPPATPQLFAFAKAQPLVRHRLQQLTQIRLTAGAENYAFVHAGVVLCRSGLVVIPGTSKIGKSFLVKELCSRGARFYSDEFAVINPQGLVETYPRDLWTRISKKERLPQSAASLGWTADLKPAPISLLLFTCYKPGAVWQPEQLGPEEMLRELAEQTKLPDSGVIASELLERATKHCSGLRGTRGSADGFLEDLKEAGSLQI